MNLGKSNIPRIKFLINIKRFKIYNIEIFDNEKNMKL